MTFSWDKSSAMNIVRDEVSNRIKLDDRAQPSDLRPRAQWVVPTGLGRFHTVASAKALG
jgi:hypothetical protein